MYRMEQTLYTFPASDTNLQSIDDRFLMFLDRVVGEL